MDGCLSRKAISHPALTSPDRGANILVQWQVFGVRSWVGTRIRERSSSPVARRVFSMFLLHSRHGPYFGFHYRKKCHHLSLYYLCPQTTDCHHQIPDTSTAIISDHLLLPVSLAPQDWAEQHVFNSKGNSSSHHWHESLHRSEAGTVHILKALCELSHH